jgi:excisionase family DNA binding protein
MKQSGQAVELAALMASEFLSTQQAAERLKVSRRRVQALIEEKRLPAVKVGRSYIVRAEDVAKLQLQPQGWPKGRPRK